MGTGVAFVFCTFGSLGNSGYLDLGFQLIKRIDMTNKHYANRDVIELDKIGEYYTRHVTAMTTENLYSKSDIAAELGYRDSVIDKQKRCITDLLVALEWAVEAFDEMANDPSVVNDSSYIDTNDLAYMKNVIKKAKGEGL